MLSINEINRNEKHLNVKLHHLQKTRGPELKHSAPQINPRHRTKEDSSKRIKRVRNDWFCHPGKKSHQICLHFQFCTILDVWIFNTPILWIFWQNSHLGLFCDFYAFSSFLWLFMCRKTLWPKFIIVLCSFSSNKKWIHFSWGWVWEPGRFM